MANNIINSADVQTFELDKFIYPIWKEDISYAEATFVRENENGIIEPLQLLYPIDEIISVRSYDLKTLYEEGKDYKLTKDGKIEIVEGGRIPFLAFKDYIFDEGGVSLAEGTPINYAEHPGKKLVYGEICMPSGGISQWVLAVTYKHSAKSVVNVPASKKENFASIINKLTAGESINVVSIGDSITEGWSSTKLKGKRAPFCPPYNELFVNYLEAKFPKAKINFFNQGVSGTCTDKANTDNIIAENPDLLMIAYGMNDGCGRAPEIYVNDIANIIKKVAAACPDVTVLVVGTCLPNKDMSWGVGGPSILKYHTDYPAALKEAEKTWRAEGYNVSYADVTTANVEMFQRKAYQDVSGSNSNHPNDYMHRVYAQVIIQTVLGEN